MIKVCMGLEDTPRKVVISNNDSSATAHNSGPLAARKQQRQGSIDDPASIVLKRRKFSYFNYSVFYVKIQFQLFVLDENSDDDTLADLPNKIPRTNR